MVQCILCYGGNKGSIEAPFFSVWRTGAALTMVATQILPRLRLSFTVETFLSKLECTVKYFRFHSRRCAVKNSSVEANQTKRFKTKKKYIEESTQSVCWLYGLILITDDWQHERTNLEGKLVSRVSGEFVFNPFLLIKR